jgi:hypothetical protein
MDRTPHRQNEAYTLKMVQLIGESRWVVSKGAGVHLRLRAMEGNERRRVWGRFVGVVVD